MDVVHHPRQVVGAANAHQNGAMVGEVGIGVEFEVQPGLGSTQHSQDKACVGGRRLQKRKRPCTVRTVTSAMSMGRPLESVQSLASSGMNRRGVVIEFLSESVSLRGFRVGALTVHSNRTGPYDFKIGCDLSRSHPTMYRELHMRYQEGRWVTFASTDSNLRFRVPAETW